MFLPKDPQSLLFRVKQLALLSLIFCGIFLFCGARFFHIEDPNQWKQAEISIADTHIYSVLRNTCQITDALQQEYLLHCSSDAFQKITPGVPAQIVYAEAAKKEIRGLTIAGEVIVDYEESVSRFSVPTPWVWVITIVGFVGIITTVCLEIVCIRRAISIKNYESIKR